MKGKTGMEKRTEKSRELYQYMVEKGYPALFCDQVVQNLNTDYTAQRMLSYLRQTGQPSLVEIADEMLAILSFRQQIMQKKALERTNVSWNAWMRRTEEGGGEK